MSSALFEASKIDGAVSDVARRVDDPRCAQSLEPRPSLVRPCDDDGLDLSGDVHRSVVA